MENNAILKKTLFRYSYYLYECLTYTVIHGRMSKTDYIKMFPESVKCFYCLAQVFALHAASKLLAVRQRDSQFFLACNARTFANLQNHFTESGIFSFH